MRISRWMILVPALAALCVLGGALSATTPAPADPGKAPAPVCQKAIQTAVVRPAPGTAHDIPTFCDTTSTHGTSKSCKDEVDAQSLASCTTGHVTNLTCSVGQSCSSGNGHYCTCSYDCTRTIFIEPEPIERR